jgi:hypothetical protein
MIIKYTGGFIGLEELAVRLGFIGPWDLRGNVVLMEDFESEETEWFDGSDAGCSAARSSRHKFSGDWAAKLYSTDISNRIAAFSRPFYFPGLSKYALFGRFCWDPNMVGVSLNAFFYGAHGVYTAVVRYSLMTTTLSVFTTGAAYYEVDTVLSLSTDTFCWFPIMVTFDLNTGYYDKLYIAEQEYDISTVPLYYAAGAANPIGLLMISTEGGTGGTPFTVYVDDIIVVKNVP